MYRRRYRRDMIADSFPHELRSDLRLKENILTLFKLMMSNEIDATALESYTSESTLYKYGKVKMDFGGLKIYVLSSVIPSEPNAKMFNIDLILEEMFEKHLETRLLLEIDNFEEKLAFQIHTDKKQNKSFIKKIISGELKLKGRYCSEVFVYLQDDDPFHCPDLVMYNDKECEKLFIIPYFAIYGDCSIGIYNYKPTFLREIICPECHFKVKDVYFQFNGKERPYPFRINCYNYYRYDYYQSEYEYDITRN